jgi:hypothetical protein
MSGCCEDFATLSTASEAMIYAGMGALFSKLLAAWGGLPAGDRAAIVISVVAMAVVIYQMSLMIVQSDLLKRQLRIMERQHEILERQLAQRVSLDMTYELRHHSDDTFLIEFRVKNTGTKAANGFYWLIFTPVNEFHELLRPDVTSKVFPVETHVEIEAAKYRQTSVYCAEPLYAARETTVAVSYVMKEKAKVPIAVWWQITSEGGLFPDHGELGKITIAV